MKYELLKNAFLYNVNGGLYNKGERHYRAKKGEKSGYKNKKGYVVIHFLGKLHYEHLLVWFLFYGYFPEGDVDHINRNKSDNRIENLREVSRSCNVINAGTRRDNMSGVAGVRYFKNRKRWRAYINIGGKTKWLGSFRYFACAVTARFEAELKHNYSFCSESNASLFCRKEGLYYE